MSVKLLELSIKDFKGISGTHIINFSEMVTFLGGANGYGKTTVYDAIELTLTGIIERVESIRGYEDGHKKHRGSILHNDPTKDIEIRLALDKDGQTKTIIATYPASSEATNTSPFVDWSKFNFELINENGESEGYRDEIDQWLGNLKDGYRLFTYLQQSDATFFLKKAQKQRHLMLNPLLDIGGSYESQTEDMNSLRTKLDAYRKHLKAQEKNFDDDTNDNDTDEVPYLRLIDGDVIHNFDKMDPFKGLNISIAKAEYAKLRDRIDELESFFRGFDPSQYVKNEQHKYLARFIQDQEFLLSAALKNHISDEGYLKTVDNYLSLDRISQDDGLLKKYVLRSFFEEDVFRRLEKTSELKSLWQDVLYVYNDPDVQQPTQKFLEGISDESNNFDTGWRETARRYLDRYKPLHESVGTYGLVVYELEEARTGLIANFHHFTDTEAFEHESTSCPLCGTDFGVHQKLIDSIESKSKSISDLMRSDQKKLAELEKEIKNELTSKIENKFAEIQKIHNFFTLLSNIRRDIGFGEVDTQIIESMIDSEEFVLDNKEIPSLEQIELNIQGLKEEIRKHNLEKNLSAMKQIRNLSKKNYSTYFAVLEKLKIDLGPYALSLADLENAPSLEAIEGNVADIRNQLKDIDSTILVRPEAVLSEHVRIFKEIFSSSEDEFNLAKQKLDQKKQYLEQKFENAYLHAKKLVTGQLLQIELLIKRIDDFRESYRTALRVYQDQLTKDLQLPFYVYSAKILQNTPQCQGIFMITQPKSGTIVFAPDQDASHDIAGQLSAGQLVVVSMAFYLAMNSVFPAYSPGFMAIDDPIQDLDVLNRHSFTELMRREFIGRYQIIMSTHDNSDMKYMAYKFNSGLEPGTIETINVQKQFFSV